MKDARLLFENPLAVGATSVRTLEHWALIGETQGETGIFLYPGKKSRRVDAILTNFHLPDSTLILLVAAFLGKDKTLAAYRHAIEQKYPLLLLPRLHANYCRIAGGFSEPSAVQLRQP